MKEVRTALRERILTGILMTLALSVAGNWIMRSQPAASVTPLGPMSVNAVQLERNGARRLDSNDPTLRLADLESTEHDLYNGTGRNIFAAYFESGTKRISPETPPDRSRSRSQPRKAETNLKFYGYALMGSVPKKVFLKDADALFVAREGDVIDGRYKVLKVEQNSLDVEDLLEQATLTIALQG